MKNILTLTLVLFATACQSQIINIKDDDGSGIANAHYADIDNILGPFEGTWLYTNGDTTLKIILLKKIDHFNSKYYEDVIIGGYEYKVGNTTLISNLNDINTPFLNSFEKGIGGNNIKNNNGYPPCPDCSVGEKRLLLMFSEFSTNMYGTILIKRTLISGQEAIKVVIRVGEIVQVVGNPLPPDDFIVPSGEYTLTKVN